MKNKLIIGTRKSPLALWQSNHIRDELLARFPGLEVDLKHIVTQGDRTQGSSEPIPAIGGKGLFTYELEQALLSGEIDLAVHCLKDLPTEMDSAFTIAAVPTRARVNDLFIARSGCRLADLPRGSTVGTSSLRRSSQLLHERPDLKIAHIRGNVDTRIRKVRDPHGEYDGTLLAVAGIDRLGLLTDDMEVLDTDTMLPAPGQGALAIECATASQDVIEMIASLNDSATAAATAAERAFLNALGAGCNTPVAAFGRVQRARGGIDDAADELFVQGRCLSPDGSLVISVSASGSTEDAVRLGVEMAEEAVRQGFERLSK